MDTLPLKFFILTGLFDKVVIVNADILRIHACMHAYVCFKIRGFFVVINLNYRYVPMRKLTHVWIL